MLSERQKLRFLNGRHDTCLTKKRSMQVRIGERIPSLTGYVKEKLDIDLEAVHRSSIYVEYHERKMIPAHGGR